MTEENEDRFLTAAAREVRDAPWSDYLAISSPPAGLVEAIARSVKDAVLEELRQSTTNVKRIDLTEFRDFGYLHEVNRLFFHPLGLALEAWAEEDGTIIALGGVWDYRDDPEGMCMGPEIISPEKAERVEQEWRERQGPRFDRLGYMVQPVDV